VQPTAASDGDANLRLNRRARALGELRGAKLRFANAMSLGWNFDGLFDLSEPFANVSLQVSDVVRRGFSGNRGDC